MRRRGLAAIVVLVLALLAIAFFVARSGDQPADLTDRTWHLRTVVQGDTTNVVGNDMDPTVRFDGREVHVDFGCNVGTGRYRAEGSDLILRPVAHTLMGCGAELQATLARTLSGRVHWAVDRSTLTLTRGGVTLTYVDRNHG